MGIDAIVSLVSLLGPKLIDLAKGLLGGKNTPEQTIAALAQTNPGALPDYTRAQAELLKVQNESVNADISGQVYPWVNSIRALIRPMITLIAALHLVLAYRSGTQIPAEAMYVYESAILSWFGSRLR